MRLTCVLVFLSWLIPASFGQSLVQILDNGPRTNRINVVFVSEGYTTNELPRFVADAQNDLNTFLSFSPFSEYSNFFNGFAISVASNESGSDHPSRGVSVDTYFSSTFDSFGQSQLITMPDSGRAKLDALLASLIPEHTIVVVLVNDTDYGGSGDGDTSIAIISKNPYGPNVLIHEMGHTMGHLGDEYSDAFPGYPDVEEPNTTTNSNVNTLKWKSWIHFTTNTVQVVSTNKNGVVTTNTTQVVSPPIPTPFDATYSDDVGLFVGAHYHTNGWYRSRITCMMRNISDSFCEICSQTLVLSLYRTVHSIQSVSPTASTSAPFNSTLNFSATLVTPASHALTAQWLVDNVVQQGANGTNFSLQVASGTHHVVLRVTDPTALVRDDPSHVLIQENSWTVTSEIPQPWIIKPGWVSNLFQFTVSGMPGVTNIVQSSSNLATWVPIATNVNSPASFLQIDKSSSTNRNRFYRVLVK